jgi:hypothetical protein
MKGRALKLDSTARYDSIRELITRYDTFKSAKQAEAEARAARLASTITEFFAGFAEALRVSQANARSEAPSFNLIRLLDLHQLERNPFQNVVGLARSERHARARYFIFGRLH